MQEIDPVQNALQSLVAAAEAVVGGGDPNRLRPALAALLRAQGQGKRARAMDAKPALPYVKVKT